jgi:TonB family protein
VVLRRPLVLGGLPALALAAAWCSARADETLSIEHTSRYGNAVYDQLARQGMRVELKSARLAGMKGDVRIAVVIGRNGALVDSRIAQSSGHREIDEAMLDGVRRAAPFPRFPSELKAFQVRMVLPLSFQLQ